MSSSLLVIVIFLSWSSGKSQETTVTNENIVATISNYEGDPNLANSVNDLGYNILLQMMQQNKNDNIVISPTGIAGLLAITLLGSVGNTYNELANAIGFSQDILANRQKHDQFSELLYKLHANDTTSKTLYANAVFVDTHSSLRNVFQDYLTRVYQGKAVNVDFGRETEVKQIINEWVKAHTEGQIENFLKQNLPASTKAILLSALYFAGQWKHPFITEYTNTMPFKTPTKEVTADFMLNSGEFDYLFSEKEGLHMISLPYNDSVTTMYALKPRTPNKLGLFELMSRLDHTKIDTLINQMTKRKSVIRFPKMDIQNNMNLKKALEAVGVKSIFAPGVANFALMIDSNMVPNKTEEAIIRSRLGEGESNDIKEKLNTLPNPGVYVDSVLHDVKLTINEYGTVAVAATAGVLARSAEQFYANSPFYIFIRNEKTKLVTFSAVIFDPTSSSTNV